jgi:phospholipase/carboxylesterase
LRETPRPETTNSVPHIQLNVSPIAHLSQKLLQEVDRLKGVELSNTRLSLPGAVGFQLKRSLHVANPDAIVGGREFAHLHPDGSLHASLDPKLARAAIKAGWATPHPWSTKRPGWEGFVMIYTPQNEQELDVVIGLIQSSYSYVTKGPRTN